MAIRPSVVPNLSVLPCGPRPANPAELLTSPRFKELLDIIRAQYDFVIVDTPPLLVVTDPCVVAPRVDGVIMAIRVTKNGRPFAERAKEILTSLGANVLGVVVNGFGTQADGSVTGYVSPQNTIQGTILTQGSHFGQPPFLKDVQNPHLLQLIKMELLVVEDQVVIMRITVDGYAEEHMIRVSLTSPV